MNKLKSILLGSVIGLALGVSLSTFLYDTLFQNIFPKIYRLSFAFDTYVTSVPIVIFLVVLGGIIGWMILIFKKQTAPPQKDSSLFWIFLILILIASISFYVFSFTTTYECEVRTRGNVQLKDACYFKKLICDKVSDQNTRDKDQCYSTLAESKMDSKICSQILNLKNQNSCVALISGKLAVREADPQKCKSIVNSDDRDFCYNVVATDIGWKNPAICEKIVGQSAKNSCYFSVALKLCDASICQKIIDIVDGNLKLDCLSAVERDKKDEYRPGGSCNFFQEEQRKLLSK